MDVCISQRAVLLPALTKNESRGRGTGDTGLPRVYGSRVTVCNDFD
jgi:hypothetical protein